MSGRASNEIKIAAIAETVEPCMTFVLLELEHALLCYDIGP